MTFWFSLLCFWCLGRRAFICPNAQCFCGSSFLISTCSLILLQLEAPSVHPSHSCKVLDFKFRVPSENNVHRVHITCRTRSKNKILYLGRRGPGPVVRDSDARNLVKNKRDFKYGTCVVPYVTRQDPLHYQLYMLHIRTRCTLQRWTASVNTSQVNHKFCRQILRD